LEFKIKPKGPKRSARILVIGPPGKIDNSKSLFCKLTHENVFLLIGSGRSTLAKKLA